MDKSILILALLGDPSIMPGYRHAGGFNKTLSELIEFIASLNIRCNIITNTNEYTQAGSIKINSNITIYRIHIDMEWIVNQDLLYECQNDLLNPIADIIDNSICTPALIHSFYWISGVLADKLSSKYHVPFIHTPISLAAEKERLELPANSKYQYSAECNFLKNADRILSISSEEANLLKSYYSIDHKKIIIVGRSVNEHFHKPAHTAQGFPFMDKLNPIFHPELYSTNSTNQWWLNGAFIYVGRIVPIKGILHIVNAWLSLFAKYTSDTPPLWIVGGDIVAIQSVRKQIHKQNLLEKCEKQQKIIWWGVLNSAGISTLLLKSSVLVSHSKFEAGGRMILEAMCQETPVIATPTGFATELVVSGYNGYIIEFSDELKLYKHMEYFVKQPYLSNAMGKYAKYTYLQAEKSFDFYQVHQNIYQHYLNGISYKSAVNPYKEIMTRSDFIDVFPYNDIGFTDTEVISILEKDMTVATKMIHRLDRVHFYLWKANEKNAYYVKQFYSIVNFRVLWSMEKEEHAIHATTLYEKAIYSLMFPHVLSCSSKYPDYCMYITPQMLSVTDKELFSEEFSDIMHQFSRFAQNQNMVHLNVTYHGFAPTDIDVAIKELLLCDLQDDDYHIVEQLYGLMKRNPDICNNKGLSYGKSLVNHVGKYNGTFVLLPTTTWFWGTLGLEFALTLLELYSLNILLPDTLENYLSRILFVPSKQILIWMVYCILLKKYYKNVPGIPACHTELLDYAFKLLEIFCH